MVKEGTTTTTLLMRIMRRKLALLMEKASLVLAAPSPQHSVDSHGRGASAATE